MITLQRINSIIEKYCSTFQCGKYEIEKLISSNFNFNKIHYVYENTWKK